MIRSPNSARRCINADNSNRTDMKIRGCLTVNGRLHVKGDLVVRVISPCWERSVGLGPWKKNSTWECTRRYWNMKKLKLAGLKFCLFPTRGSLQMSESR